MIIVWKVFKIELVIVSRGKLIIKIILLDLNIRSVVGKIRKITKKHWK